MFTWSELKTLMELVVPAAELQKRYNVAPSQRSPVIRKNNEGVLIGDLLRWGLIPSWAKDSKIGYSLINARSETVASKPSFRSAFKQKRCIVPMSGFYEWQQIEGQKRKQPYYMTRKHGGILLVAGLWEEWKPQDGDAVISYCVLTTSANALMQTIHDRMPTFLTLAEAKRWLDPEQKPANLLSMLKPADDELLEKAAVSTLVNSPKSESVDCIKPLDHPDLSMEM